MADDCYFRGVKTNLLGVAILLKNNFGYEVLEINHLLLKLNYDIESNATGYAPNNDDPTFLMNNKIF